MTAQEHVGTSQDEVERIHRDILVLDSHLDILVSMSHPLLRLPNGASHADLDRLLRGQVNAVVLSVAVQVFPELLRATRRRRPKSTRSSVPSSISYATAAGARSWR